MKYNITRTIETLRQHGIFPRSTPGHMFPQHPEMSRRTSVERVMGQAWHRHHLERLGFDDLRPWLDELARIISGAPQTEYWGRIIRSEAEESIEPRLAWYQAIHFHGEEWGIYITESGLLNKRLSRRRQSYCDSGISFLKP
jgi:hypothetical protein